MRKKLKPGAVPSQFEWTQPVQEATICRQQRVANRELNLKRKEMPENFVSTEFAIGSEIECETNQPPATEPKLAADTSTQTETPATSDTSTQTQRSRPFTLDKYAMDDAAIHFYTGLENYLKVCFVLSTLGSAQEHLDYMFGSVKDISVRDQFFMVLMKLRRHYTNFELSRMFAICEKQVYNIFCTWIRFMTLQWNEINIWPSRDLVRYFSPTDFRRKFPSTRVMFDGTECPIKRPRLPRAQQSTFSTYKNRNTMKVLVGATPAGLISYVSPAYGGSTSDRQIVERSNIPAMCDPGDSVMADKGFNVQDIFAPYDVSINIPAFFRKQNKIKSSTVLSDRKLSSKRVHIERIIGLAKTYKILTRSLNQSETMLSSDIIYVCFMLCNFRNKIVPRHA